jgi:hypothetical protein
MSKIVPPEFNEPERNRKGNLKFWITSKFPHLKLDKCAVGNVCWENLERGKWAFKNKEGNFNSNTRSSHENQSSCATWAKKCTEKEWAEGINRIDQQIKYTHHLCRQWCLPPERASRWATSCGTRPSGLRTCHSYNRRSRGERTSESVGEKKNARVCTREWLTKKNQRWIIRLSMTGTTRCTGIHLSFLLLINMAV